MLLPCVETTVAHGFGVDFDGTFDGTFGEVEPLLPEGGKFTNAVALLAKTF
jgi:hypothetical protein